MKPLIILRFPKLLNDSIQQKAISDYLKQHPASDDYHFLIIVDAMWDGPVDFQYFNESSYQSSIH
jgi:hypothetical protein